jgi:hypothetical protein
MTACKDDFFLALLFSGFVICGASDRKDELCIMSLQVRSKDLLQVRKKKSL